MRRLFFAILICPFAAGLGSRQSIAQTALGIASHYKVVPQVSTLAVSPRFLEIATVLYRVSGNYDFVRLGMPAGGAEFANSDIVATDFLPTPTATPPVILDVDKIFNM